MIHTHIHSVIIMTSIRATIVIDEFLAYQVKQMFNGNLSKGITELVQAHLKEKKKDDLDEMFGIYRNRKFTKDLYQMRAEEKENERRKFNEMYRN